MPKDEFDFDDPMELSGVALVTEEDTTDVMCECFIEEFMRLGYNAKQILALFRNSHYLGMNMVLQNRGEPFVRNAITDVFARWGRIGVAPISNFADQRPNNGARLEARPALTDPMGAPVPKLSV